MARYPQRVVCLTTETVEVMYALGAAERVVGISGYTVRPPEARKEKPKVYAFTSGDIDKILAVSPDLVLTFSNLQADIARDLIKAGIPVHAFNQRSVDDILGMIETVGRLLGLEAKALAWVADLEAQIAQTREIAAKQLAAAGGQAPRVYFEEWNDPLISSIRWASELIEIAGGIDIFAAQSHAQSGRDRIIADPHQVIALQPEVIIGSWCGRRFRPEQVAARPGWDTIPAVQTGRLHEMKSAIILTPGPVAISEGLPQLLQLLWPNMAA